MKPNVTVVILAAGLGTRMKSSKAKVLHEAGGDTLLNQVIRAALHVAAPEQIVAVVGHQAAEVQKSVSGQRDPFRGTGRAERNCPRCSVRPRDRRVPIRRIAHPQR